MADRQHSVNICYLPFTDRYHPLPTPLPLKITMTENYFKKGIFIECLNKKTFSN